MIRSFFACLLLVAGVAWGGGSAEFARASTEGLSVDAVAPTDYPVSICGWVKHNVGGSTGSVAGFASSTSDGNYILLYLNATNFYPLCAARSGAGAQRTATGSIGATANEWVHLCCVLPSWDSRYIWMDGDQIGSDLNGTALSSFPAVDRTSIGFLNRLTPIVYMEGLIADVRVYDVELNDAEIKQLARGCQVSRGLVAWWPLNHSDYNLEIYGTDSTCSNCPDSTNDPPPISHCAAGAQ